MSTLTPARRSPARPGAARPSTFSPSDRRLSPRRVRALAWSEIRLLLRNRALLFYSAGLPLAAVLFLTRITGSADMTDAERTVQLVMTVTGFALLFGVFYSLVSTYVARRQDLVLKRLRAGESSALDVLAAIAAPTVLIMIVQVVVVSVVSAVVVGVVAPANAALVVLGVAGGALVTALLAAVCSAFSRTVESVQVTTLPALLVLMMAPGFVVPADALPDAFVSVGRFLPLAPVVELVELGIAGTDRAGEVLDLAGTFAAAVQPLAVLVVWCVLGAWLTARFFSWEPRR